MENKIQVRSFFCLSLEIQMDKINYPIDSTMNDVVNKKCPILHALSIIGQKWKLSILWYLHEKENTRYNELKRRIPGITNIMLTKSLRELETAGLVCRHVFDLIPPKVEYSLTPLGLELIPALNELYQWGYNHMQQFSINQSE